MVDAVFDGWVMVRGVKGVMRVGVLREMVGETEWWMYVRLYQWFVVFVDVFYVCVCVEGFGHFEVVLFAERIRFWDE